MMATDSTPGGDSNVDEVLRVATRSPDRTLFILSVGFDPRSFGGLARHVRAVNGAPHVLAVEPQSPTEIGDPKTLEESSLIARRVENEKHIRSLSTRSYTNWAYPKVFDEASAGRDLARRLTSANVLTEIDTVIFDLSAFPTSLAFPMLNGLLKCCGTTGFPSELLVLVTENPGLDGDIAEGGLGVAHQLPGFGRRSRRARSRAVRVWAPVLGRGAGSSMKKVADLLDPQEVCPILPFPARDPRLVDRLLLEHHDLIVDRFEVQPTSFIYAAETNPFDLYRTLVKFDIDYQAILDPVGGADVTVSSHGSKLLSIGALLAAYERELQFLAVRATKRYLSPECWSPSSRDADRLACVWLKGEPYKTM